MTLNLSFSLIKGSTLMDILNVLYHGEVKIIQEDLDSFLNAANVLDIPMNSPNINIKSDEQDNADIDNSNVEEVLPTDNHLEKKIEIRDEKNQTDLQFLNQYVIKNEQLKKWECTFCGKLGNTNGNMKMHAEVHLSGLSYPCSRCKKVFKTRMSLYSHKNSRLC